MQLALSYGLLNYFIIIKQGGKKHIFFRLETVFQTQIFYMKINNMHEK